MTTTWLEATPELLLILVVLIAPGMLVARCLTFRWWDAVGLSVPLSLGVLAIADELAAKGGVQWGLPAIVGTTVLVTVLSWAVARFVLKRDVDEGAPETTVYDGQRWSRRGYLIAGLVTLAAAVLGGFAVARGIGTPHSINQTWDAIFHVNTINGVAQHHSGSPTAVSNGGGSTGFYPPLFAAVAALSTIYGGLSPIVAANIASVAIAIAWPLTMSLALRRIARPGIFGYSIAMWGAVTIALFPALLLQYGTVWPNALSMLSVAPALVLMLRVLGLDRRPNGTADPHGALGLWPSVIALVLMLPGIAFAQPASAFALFYFGAPMVIWFLWRRLIALDAPLARRVVLGGASVLAVGLVSMALIWASYRVSTIRSTGNFFWPIKGSILSAVQRVLELGSLRGERNLAFGALTLVGIVMALRHARGRWLAICYLIVATLYVFAFAIQSHLTMRLTGYWYNDAFRLIGMLPLFALPLAALGADGVLGWIRKGLSWILARGTSLEPRRATLVCVVSVALVCAGVVGAQSGLGLDKPTNTVSQAYANSWRRLVTPDEVAMFQRLKQELPKGEVIAGNPFRGEALVGILSGHPSVYPAFSTPAGSDRILVGQRFEDYLVDPTVCAAVRRLKIAVIVDGPRYPGRYANKYAYFAGFPDLSKISRSSLLGSDLRVIDSGGGATAYQILFQHGVCKK